jgi:hypothetical protein
MHVARDDSDARRDDSSALSSAGVWERGTGTPGLRDTCAVTTAPPKARLPTWMLSCVDSSDTLEAVAALCKAMGANPWFSSAHGRTHTAEFIRE